MSEKFPIRVNSVYVVVVMVVNSYSNICFFSGFFSLDLYNVVVAKYFSFFFFLADVSTGKIYQNS